MTKTIFKNKFFFESNIQGWDLLTVLDILKKLEAELVKIAH